MKLAIRLRLLGLFALCLIGLLLRLYGLNWDQGNSFHPDERQIIFHVIALRWPSSWGQFLTAQQSPLNPHFFAYGSFPIYLLAFVAYLLHYDFANSATFFSLLPIGRIISALFDTGTIFVAAALGWRLANGRAKAGPYLARLKPVGDDSSPYARHASGGHGRAKAGPSFFSAKASIDDSELLQASIDDSESLQVKEDVFGSASAWHVALLTAALVAFTPLELQLSHFYAVDTILLFFIILTILACVALVESRKPLRWAILAGIGYGLALGTKFSALPLAMPLFIALALRAYKTRRFWRPLALFILIILISLLIFAMIEPYAFLDFSSFKDGITTESTIARGIYDVPYTRQFAGTIPYLYQIQNMVFWGMGVTLGCAGLLGMIGHIFKIIRQIFSNDAPEVIKMGRPTAVNQERDGTAPEFGRDRVTTDAIELGPYPRDKSREKRILNCSQSDLLWLVPLSFIFVYSMIIGSFYTKYMRYVLPIYPLLTVMAAAGVLSLVYHCKAKINEKFDSSLYRDPISLRPLRFSIKSRSLYPFLGIGLQIILLAGTIFQGLALLSIYSQPNTRIQASRWMYHHLRPGAVITYEQWDDALPVAVDGYYPSQFVQAKTSFYGGQGLDLYGEDTVQKAQQLADLLPTLDAITMATDRLDKSIPRSPARYPITTRYYQLLFSGQLGFHLAAQFDNYPHLLGITLDDSNADESYSVFDHPTSRIFVRDMPYPFTADQLFHKLIGK